MSDDRTNEKEGSGPEKDLTAQNPGETTVADMTDAADEVDEDDPPKAEKLTSAGRDIDPDEGAE